MRWEVGFGEERGEGRGENLPEGFRKVLVTVVMGALVVADEVELLRDWSSSS